MLSQPLFKDRSTNGWMLVRPCTVERIFYYSILFLYIDVEDQHQSDKDGSVQKRSHQVSVDIQQKSTRSC